jgi:serine/threonine protein kinase
VQQLTPVSLHDSLHPPMQSGEVGRLRGHRILSLIGEGGMGQVFCAEETSLVGRRVALKVIRPRYAADPHFRDRFLREMRTLASLTHQHVVPVYQADEDNNTLFFTMELLTGASLWDVLKHSSGFLPDAGSVVRIAADLADGLEAIHNAGVIHRDLKPSNVFLRTPAASDKDADEARLRGWVLLLDFGLASTEETERLTQPGDRPGTPGYVAPEAPPFGRRTDLYALGVMLYQMLCGEVPSPDQKLAGHASLPSTVPAALVALTERLIASDPNQRPGSAGEVARQLREIEQALKSAPKAPPGEVDLSLTVRRLVAGTPGEVLASTAGIIPAMTRGMKRLPTQPQAQSGPGLKTGDHVSIQVSVNVPGYVTVFNVSPLGELDVLHPEQPIDERNPPPPLPAGQYVRVVDVELTPPGGTEKLYAVWNAQPRSLGPFQLRELLRRGELPAHGATRGMKVIGRPTDAAQCDVHVVALELEHGD